MIENTILKKVWGFLVNPASRQAPQTKITKKIRNGIINTNKRTNRSINNQLRLSLFVLVYKYSHYKRCI